ncbi:MAG: 8-amino-7-oxononanoate synthase [Bacteroidota bacterium]
MTSLDEHLYSALQKRKQTGNLRSLALATPLQDFFSNDYLGLARNPYLARQIRQREEAADYVQNGSTGSRLLSGNSLIALQTEKRLAMTLKTEAALIFGSGYAANTAVLSSLPQKGDTIVMDELCHASLKEGARLSFARRITFRHNDPDSLRSKLKLAEGRAYVVTEAVFSMDGDECPLAEIIKACNEFGAFLILDEAHTTGLRGDAGSGLASELGLADQVPVRIHTFGKAMGVHGACVAGSALLAEYLVNFARPFIYSTAPPPHSFIAIDAAFYYLSMHPELPTQLQRRINTFRNSAAEAGLGNRIADSKSPIQVLFVPGNENAKQASEALRNKGLDVRPVLAPTVPIGTERLRICLHVFNTDAEIRALISAISIF